MISRGAPSVGQVLAGLDRGPRTEKGRGIQDDINQLNEDFFGKPARPLVSGGGGASAGDVRERLIAATTTNTPAELCRSIFVPSVAVNRWARGPADPEGVLLDLSDRNLLCMDVSPYSNSANLCVAGSADHGLVLCDIEKKRKVRSLYTKTAGHSEWVTACKFTPEGKILSGGMDSKLCLWFANAPRCDDLMGHTGSVSDVVVNEHNYAISASYDRTLRVWDLAARRCSAVLSAHSQPVMHVAWKHSALVSGDRGGKLHVWDASCGKSVVQLQTKGGQTGALEVFGADGVNNLVCAGDQAGTLSVWDFQRTGDVPIFQNVVHPGGVLCDIKQSSPGTGNGLLVTAGADRKIQILEPRQNMQPVYTFTEHRDFIYSLQCAGESLVLSGGGNGWLLAHDIKTGKCLYGIGASTAAVRSIGYTSNKLCCAGDDGKLAIFDFP
jgi:WD40 repeat protein